MLPSEPGLLPLKLSDLWRKYVHYGTTLSYLLFCKNWEIFGLDTHSFCLSFTSNNPQGLMFGYATDETEECMPLTVVLAHAMNRKISDLR